MLASDEERKFLFQRHIAYLKPKRELINSYYLHGALLSPEGQRQIEERVKGIAQKTWNKNFIKKLKKGKTYSVAVTYGKDTIKTTVKVK